MQTLQKSFGRDCKPRSPVSIRMQKRSHTHVKDPVDYVTARWTKPTQHALNVSVFIILKLDTIRKKKKK